jgi:hypothetical protein
VLHRLAGIASNGSAGNKILYGLARCGSSEERGGGVALTPLLCSLTSVLIVLQPPCQKLPEFPMAAVGRVR